MDFYDIFHLMRLTSRFAPFCLVSCHLKLSNNRTIDGETEREGGKQRNNKYIETSYVFITQRKIVVFFFSFLFNKIVSNRQRITPPIFFIMIIIIILDVSFAFRISQYVSTLLPLHTIHFLCSIVSAGTSTDPLLTASSCWFFSSSFFDLSVPSMNDSKFGYTMLHGYDYNW